MNNWFSNRIKESLNHYSITPIDFVENIGIKPSHALNRVAGIGYLTISDIQKILIAYPEVNARWLLLGEGDILIK